MFNLLISGNETAWESEDELGMSAGRFGEFSGKEAANISPANPDSLRVLQNVPTILMYEEGANQSDVVRFGYIYDIHVYGGQVLFRFVEHSRTTRDVIQRFLSKLHIERFEQNRTHWAVKDDSVPSELLAVLSANNRPKPANADNANKDLLTKVESLKNILVAWAEGNKESRPEYANLRMELIGIPEISEMLPQCVRTCRNQGEFWGFIKHEFSTYRERRDFLKLQFEPLLSHLESNVFVPLTGRKESKPQMSTTRNAKRVFIVYGRNIKAYNAMTLFLQSLGLEPKDFMEVRNELGGSPFIGEIVRRGLDQAQAYIILFTPDEFAALHPDLSRKRDASHDQHRWQPRPNVLIEAGMAMAMDENRTLLVIMGDTTVPSDFSGRHVLRISNDINDRKVLKDALSAIHCDVVESGRWHDPAVAGDFDACLVPPSLKKADTRTPFV
jgi:predicted nucleotide-binding protein